MASETNTFTSGSSSTGGASNLSHDDAVMAQVASIQAEVARAQALVSASPQPLSDLVREYEESAGKDSTFVAKLRQVVARGYAQVRRVRGDGNCFYRAYLFGVLHYLASPNPSAETRAKLAEQLKGSMARLVALGFSEIAVETFYDVFIEEIEAAVATAASAKEASREAAEAQEVATRFAAARVADESVSDYLVAYLRMLTSGHLQAHEDEYVHFLSVPLAQFIKAEVEPMGKECDMVQCMALTREIGLPVRIMYVDLSPGDVNHHDLGGAGESQEPAITLLYRPGHYDILYR